MKPKKKRRKNREEIGEKKSRSGPALGDAALAAAVSRRLFFNKMCSGLETASL